MGTSVNSAGTTAIKSEPNVIPMIDIMLVLLIIFMIVTPLISAGFHATMPHGNHLDKDAEKDGEVILGIDDVGNYFLNSRPIALDQLEPQLQAIYAARTEDKVLYFKADVNVKYAKIQEAVEVARRSGVRVLAAVTEQQGGMLAGAGEEN